MTRVLITGAGRGIGLALTRQYAQAGDEVIACVRDPEASEELTNLAAQSSVRIVAMDLADFASIDAARREIGDMPLDVLINNAGATGGAQQSIDDIDLEAWHRTFDVNTIAPLLVARAFKPNLAASGNGKLLNVTSQLAASTWPMGGMLIYATTKAALSKIGQILAADWKDEPIISALMHPGWVKTDMGGPHAQLTADESANGIRRVIAGLTAADSGKFYKWNGDIHPW